MKNTILAYLVLALTVLGCNPTPTPAPSVPDASTAPPPVDAAAPVAMCGDEPCGTVHPPPPPPKVDPRSQDEIANAGCVGPGGKWLCTKRASPPVKLMASGNATAAQCGPACTVGNWYIDPQNTTTCASDGNSCTSATCAGAGIGPCLTFAQITTRLGSTTPQYPAGQSVQVNLLSSQTAGVDPIFFEPNLASTGAAASQSILMVSLVPFGSPFALGAGTADKVRGAPGSLTNADMTAGPGGITKNMLVVNTSTHSQALIDSFSAPNATMQQPQTTASLTSTAVAPVPVEDDTWANTNTVQVYSLLNVNLKMWRARGGDESPASQPVSSWVFYANVVDTSGTGASVYFHGNDAALSVLTNCVMQTRTHVSTTGGRGNAVYLNGSSMVQQLVVLTPAADMIMFGGGESGGATLFGGVFKNDPILHGSVSTLAGTAEIFNVYADGALSVQAGQDYVLGIVWGAYAATVNPGGLYYNASSTFAASGLLTSGALKLGTLTTGCSPPVGGTYNSNGSTQVDTACAFGTVAAPGNCFPAAAPISISLATAVSPSPQFFSAAQTAGTFHTKGTAGDTSTYNWTAGRVCGVPITQANLDYTTGFGSLCNIAGDACFANTN